MIKNELLVLAAKAFEDQIKSAQVALEDNFRTPIKAWLKTLVDQEREVDGTVKAYIRRILPTDPVSAVSAESTERAFEKAVQTKKFSATDYAAMVDSGLLTPIGGEQLAQFLVDHGIGTMPGYTILIPGTPAGWTDELRLTVMAKGRFEGLKASLKKTVDLEETIRLAAKQIETTPLATGLAHGHVNIKTSKP